MFWDLPGHGLSEKREQPYTLGDCAQALHELLIAQGMESSIVVGWSMGGSVFWEYLKRYGTERIKGFVNVESLPWADEALFQVDATSQALTKDRQRAMKKFIQNMFCQKPEPSDLDWMMEESFKTPLSLALPLYSEMVASDYRAIAKALKVPSLSIFGRAGFYRDQVPELEKILPFAQVQWCEKSGHLPFWEESTSFNQLLQHWVSSL